MTESERTSTADADLSRWFAQHQAQYQAGQDARNQHHADALEFTRQVTDKTARLRRRNILLRFLLMIVLSTLAVPVQDLAISLSQLVMVNLVPLENSLAAQLLAPVNTVGSLLSLLILTIRLLHKRIFR